MRMLLIGVMLGVVGVILAEEKAGAGESDSVRAKEFVLLGDDGKDAACILMRGSRIVVLTGAGEVRSEVLSVDTANNEVSLSKDLHTTRVSPRGVRMDRRGEGESGDFEAQGTLGPNSLSFWRKRKGAKELSPGLTLISDEDANGLHLYDGDGNPTAWLEATRSDEGRGPWMTWLNMQEKATKTSLILGWSERYKELRLSFIDADLNRTSYYGPQPKKD